MKKIKLISSFIIIGGIFMFNGCDSKEVAKTIALSEYNKLKDKYELLIEENNKLKIENDNLKQKNLELVTENEKLKNQLIKYKNGFKSMYE